MNADTPPPSPATPTAAAADVVPDASQGLAFQIEVAGAAPRPAWVEVNSEILRQNAAILQAALPPNVRWLAVVKDQAYGHGAVAVGRAALEAGASFLALNTLTEAAELRNAGLEAPLLILGERHPDELPFCLQYGLRVCVGDLNLGRLLNRLALEAHTCVPFHLEVDTGMSRFGVRWDQAAAAATELVRLPGLVLEGVLSHFSMSDEADKSFARVQIERFQSALNDLAHRGVRPGLRHLCNSGGFLDLPEAHFDMVRIGILLGGVYPSAVCRRLPGLEPALSVHARIVTVRALDAGDVFGYGLKYRAPAPRRIGVLPLGYGDGFPRLRNQGHVLVQGQPAPIIGGVAMDALGIDLTDIPGARLWDEAVVLGRQGGHEISAHDLARWQGSVSYDILAGWRARLPRVRP